MGCDQSTESGARWRRTYAQDFNPEKPPRRYFSIESYNQAMKSNLSEKAAANETEQGAENYATTTTNSNNNGNNNSNNNNETQKAPADAIMLDDRIQDEAIGQQQSKKKLTSMKVYSWEEITKHNNEHDCWMVIEDIVYDVTNFMPGHPGGFSLVAGSAGRDATEAFNRAHPNLPKVKKILKEAKSIKVIGKVLLDISKTKSYIDSEKNSARRNKNKDSNDNKEYNNKKSKKRDKRKSKSRKDESSDDENKTDGRVGFVDSETSEESAQE